LRATSYTNGRAKSMISAIVSYTRLEIFNGQVTGCGRRRPLSPFAAALRAEPLLHECRAHVAGAACTRQPCSIKARAGGGGRVPASTGARRQAHGRRESRPAPAPCLQMPGQSSAGIGLWPPEPASDPDHRRSPPPPLLKIISASAYGCHPLIGMGVLPRRIQQRSYKPDRPDLCGFLDMGADLAAARNGRSGTHRECT
jgi:hypothetical protein